MEKMQVDATIPQYPKTKMFPIVRRIYEVWHHPSEGGDDIRLFIETYFKDKKESDEMIVHWLKQHGSVILDDWRELTKPEHLAMFESN